MNENWLIGFIEAECSFTRGSTTRRYKDKLYKYKYPSFKVTQTEAVEILKYLKNFFGVGSIQGNKEYVVNGRKGCIIIANFLQGKLIIKKRQKQFENWRKQFKL